MPPLHASHAMRGLFAYILCPPLLQDNFVLYYTLHMLATMTILTNILMSCYADFGCDYRGSGRRECQTNTNLSISSLLGEIPSFVA